MRRGVLLVAHGTRVPAGVLAATCFAEGVANRLKAQNPLWENALCRLAFLEISTPDIYAVATHMYHQEGIRELYILPLLLLSAGHALADLPRMIDDIQRDCPHLRVRMSSPLNDHERLVKIYQQHIHDALQQESGIDALLFVNRGSSYPHSYRIFQQIVQQTSALFPDLKKTSAFFAGLGGGLPRAFHRLEKSGVRECLVLPHLLFPGRLSAQLDRQLKEWAMGHAHLHFRSAPLLGESEELMDVYAKQIVLFSLRRAVQTV